VDALVKSKTLEQVWFVHGIIDVVCMLCEICAEYCSNN